MGLQMKRSMLMMAGLCVVASLAWAQPATQPAEPTTQRVSTQGKKRQKQQQRAAAAAMKVKVPPVAETEAAAAKLKEIYRTEYSKQSTTDLIEFSRRLTQDASKMSSDRALQYAMFTQGIEIAAKGWDAPTAMAAADALAARFEVDTGPLRVKALIQIGRNVKNKDDAALLLAAAKPVLESQAEAGQFEEVTPLMRLIQSMSHAMPDAVGAEDAQEQVETLLRQGVEYSKIRMQALKLSAEPDNAAANAAVGRYLAMVREDWDAAVPLLRKGDDAVFRAAAELDDDSSDHVAEQIKVGDAWVAVALKQQLSQRAAIYKRALQWYRDARPATEGAERLAVDRKIEETRQGIVGPGKPTFLLDLIPREAAAVQKFRDHYYLVAPSIMGLELARHWATKRGAHLPSVTDKLENDFINSLMRSGIAREPGNTKEPYKGSAWLGGAEMGLEGVWGWEDGTPWRYTNWDNDEPSNSHRIENRLVMNPNGKWNDVPQHVRAMVIVKW